MRRNLFFAVLLSLCSVFAACANPNGGGVQDFGGVQGRLVDAKSQRVPGNVTNATVNIGDKTVQPDANGVFNLQGIPVGDQPLTVHLDGYGPLATTVRVDKDKISDVQFVQLAPLNLTTPTSR